MAATTFVQLDPEELVFRDVKLSQVYTQTLRVTNTLRGPVELTIKPGSSERYTVVPGTIRLRGEEAAAVEVRLRVIRFAQRQKAVEQGHRDVFHIKGSHFDQKFYATFYMMGADQAAGARARSMGGTAAVGAGQSRSPPPSPTRPRRALAKSVSFSDPSSPRRADSGRLAPGPLGSSDTGGRSGRDASGSDAGGGGLSPSQHVRGGLRQALSGLRSPQKGVAFYAMELGAQDVQRDALDRANVSGGAFASGGIARLGAAPSAIAQQQPGVSASIDFGQLHGRAAAGDSRGAAVMAMGGATALDGSNSFSQPSRPPRAPSQSLPPSPGRDNRAAPLPRPALPSAPYSGSQQQQQGAAADQSRQQSMQRARPQQAPSFQGLRAVRDSSPQREALQPLPPFRSLEDARTSRDSGSPGRGVQGNRYGGASTSPQQPSLIRPVEVPELLGGVGTGPGGMSRAQWQQRRQEEQQRGQQRARQDEEQARQLVEEETRALGLHLVRDSLDSLGMEADRMRDRSLSPSPIPPWRRGDTRTASATADAASDGELEDTAVSGTAGRAAGRGRGREPERSRSRSRSPEAMLLPPRDRLAELVARRAGITRTAGGVGGQSLNRSASAGISGGRRVAASLLQASSGAGASTGANPGQAPYAPPAQESQLMQQPAPQPPLPASYLQSGPRQYGRSLSAQAALSTATAPAQPPAAPAALTSPGTYGSSPAAAHGGLPYTRTMSGGAGAGTPAAAADPASTSAAFGTRLAAQSPSLPPTAARTASFTPGGGGDVAGPGHGDALELQLQLRSMERQQASMRRTIEQQQEVLRDKEELLKALQAQLQTTKSQLASAASPRTDIATEQIATERTALANERSALAARLAEAEAALQTSREECAALRRLQLELQSRHPELTRAVEAAVRKEQAQQEDRNRKALEMLMGKDKRIGELEAQVEDLQRGSERLRGQVAELQERAQAAEDQVIAVLRQKEALVETSQRDRTQAEHMIGDLEARLADGNDLAVELLATQEALSASERRAAAAEQQLAAAEHRAMQVEAMAAGVEAMQRRLYDQRDGHVDTALAMAEELRARSVALQEHHAEAMRLQADAHRRQVAELESRISELAAELESVTEQCGGDQGGDGPRPHTAESRGTRRQPASRQQQRPQPGGAGEDDEELDVSLGAGMVADPRDLVSAITSGGRQARAAGQGGSASRAAGQQPAGDLQAANARLQAEVEALRRQLVSAAASPKDRAWDQAELERLRALVAERDIEVADLGSQLQVLKARLAVHGAGAAGGPAGAGARPARSPGASPGPAYRGRGTAAFLSPSRERAAAAGGAGAGRGAGGGRAQSAERECGAVGGGGGGGSSEDAAVIETLRRQLAKSEAALRGAKERLSMVEARAAVAHESAGKGEQQLEAVHRSMVGSALEHECLQQELEAARATAAKLNGRISDLVLAEQVARAEVEAAKAKLGQLQELHTAEVLELRQRLERLTDHVAAVQPEVLPVLLGPAYTARAAGAAGQQPSAGGGAWLAPSASAGAAPTPAPGMPTSRAMGGDALTREAELEKAVEAAETAVAVMQSRLLAALKEAADAAEEAARVRREADRERDRLEAEVRAAREEGSLRIRTLEESVARLGARGGEAPQALARSAAEADAAVRRESRLRSELALAQQAAQRANMQTAEIRLRLKECEAALREAQVYGGLLPFLHDVAAAAAPPAGGPTGPQPAQAVGTRPPGGAPGPAAAGAGNSSGAGGGGGASGAVSYHVLDEQLEVKLRQQAAEIARKQQVISRLVDVAEQAQGEAAAVKSELDRLKQAAPDPKQPLQQQYADVQRRLGATDAELRACKDAKASCELEVARLQQQLAERARELDLAAERLAGCEREVAAKENAAARKAIEVQGAMGKEAAVLGRRVAEAQRAADDAEARAREADAQLVNLKAELAEARAELASQGSELRKAKLRLKDERRAAEEALRQAKRAGDLAKAEAEERRSQLSVLMETVEVLQAGSQGEREQRIVSLTAQLTAAANRESVADQRAQALLDDADACSFAVQQLQGEVADLEQQAARLEQQLAAAASSRLTLEGELAAARADVRSRDAEALRAARELDDRQARLDRVEGELEAVRRALNDCSARHTEQLAREREEAAAAVRQARAETSGVAAGHAQAARLEKFEVSLDEVVAWIESRMPPPAGESDAAGSALTVDPTAPASSWVVTTLHRLKTLALESERSFLGAATDARVYRQESRWAWGRVQRLQAALEQRTGEWQVAQARVQMLERCVSRRSEEAAMHALEMVALQDRQLGALQERLTTTVGKLVVATSQAAGAEAAMTAARATIAALQLQVTAGGAERKELAARLAAAEMESSGCAEAVQLGAEAAQAQRDLALRQYWDAQVSSLLARPEVKDKVMALAREVCALKLSESQLQAALAAARHRGDAACKLAASRAASLRGAEEAVEHMAQQQLVSVAGTTSGAEGGGNPSPPLSALAAGGAAAGGLGLEVARLSAQLVAQTHELFRLQESELRAKQAYERRQSDLQELQAQVAAAELLLSQVRAEGSAALLALREQLSEAHEQDRELLMRELRELQARLVATHNMAAKDVEAAEQRIAEAAQAADAAVEQRVSAALQGQVDATQLQEVAARAARAEREAVHLTSQVEALQEALTQAQAQVGELEDVRDVTGTAVASLEATLARIEKAAADAVAAPGRGRQFGGSAGGARRVPIGGAATPGADGQQQPQGFAALSRELVRAKLTEAEALRKMRAVARNEVELRQKLMQRDERIAELKDQLAAKGQAYEEMRRRSALMEPPAARQAAGGPGAGAGAAGGGARGAAFRSRSPSPVRGGGPGVPSSRPGTAAGRRASAEHAPTPPDAAAIAAGAAADAEHLAAQVSQLRLELARRQAEIDRLQGALAEANAAVAVPVTEPPAPARPPAAPAPIRPSSSHGNPAALDRLKDQLASANAELAAALSAANGLLRRLGSAPTTTSSAAKRAGSPARGRSTASGAAGSDVGGLAAGSWSDSQLSPGALSAAMDRLAQAVQLALFSAAGSSSGLRSRAGAVSPTRGSAAQAEELMRAQQELVAAERQRDELAGRCGRLEREVEAFRARVAALQVAARPAAATSVPAAPGAGTAASAAQNQGPAAAAAAVALERSVTALHAMCDRVQRAASSSTGPVDAATVQQAMHALSTELRDMESALAQLRAVMDGTPSAAPAAAPAASEQPAALAGAGSRRRIEPLPTSLFASLAAAAAGANGEGARGAADADAAGRQGADPSVTPARFALAAPQHTPATTSSWATATPGTALHAGLAVPQTAGPAPVAVDTTALTTALDAAQSQAAAMSTAAAQQKARADKWKQRSKELGAQLSLLNASASAREAAASERNLASSQHAEQELGWCRAEISKLQAALSGAEAARKELEASQSAGGSSELRAALARAAEAAARAATLQRQLETERAQAAAASASQREEVAVLKAAVAQEKGERARLLVSLRESHTNAQHAGDSEAKLRNEALEAHSAAAAARATAERVEERASAWRDEASTLRQQLQQAERARAQTLSGLEMRLAAAERRATEAAAGAAVRIDELVAKLAAAQAEAAAAPVAFETRLRDMEARLADMQAQSTAVQQAAQSSVQASRWGALTRVARYQAAVKSLQAELAGRTAEWERERTGLQGAAEGAVRRAETLLAELTDLRQQVSELKSVTDADRQELTSRHVAHVQELQKRIEQERLAMAEEADARAEAAAAATAAAAQQAEGVRLGALEGEYRGRLAALDAERAALSRELELVQAQFSQYQSQKAAEVATLEQRIRAYIDSGGAPAARSNRRSVKRAYGADADADEDAPGASYGSPALRPAFGGGSGGGGYRGAGSRAVRRQGGAGSRAAARNGRRGAGSAAGAEAAGVAAAVLVPTMLQQVTIQPVGAPAGPGGAAVAPLQPMQLAPSQLVALARGTEALAAGQREVAFERSLRCRAEAQAGLLRGAMARLRAKLRTATEELAVARADAISPDEHRQLQADLSVCREQLKSCRAESARRQKALTVLQGLVSQDGTAAAAGVSAAGIGAAAPTASSAARMRAAGGFAATAAAAPVPLPPRIAPTTNLGVTFPLPPGFDSFDGTPFGLGGGASAGDSDPLPAALEAAAAGARTTAVALEAERGARAALEAKLRETKAALDRKTILHKETKRRVEELEAAASQRVTAAVADNGAEARAKSLAATLSRKEALVRELREKLEAATAAAERGDAAAAAGGEELEAARRAGSRMKADLARREAALRAATVELEKERKMLAAATKQLDEGSRRAAAARRQAASAAAALRRRAGELLEGLRGLARLLLQAVAAMDVAADRLRQHRPAAGPLASQPAVAAAAGGGGSLSSDSSSSGGAAAAGGGLMSAVDISQLTSLSLDDVRHLLGPEVLPPGFGRAGGADADAERALLAQPHPLSNGSGASGAAVAASLEAAQRVGDLLAVLEVALATVADACTDAPASPASATAAASSGGFYAMDGELIRDQVLAAEANAADPASVTAPAAALRGRGSAWASVAGRGGRSGATAGIDDMERWDAGTLQALVSKAQEEAQRAEGALAVALQRAGAL